MQRYLRPDGETGLQLNILPRRTPTESGVSVNQGRTGIVPPDWSTALIRVLPFPSLPELAAEVASKIKEFFPAGAKNPHYLRQTLFLWGPLRESRFSFFSTPDCIFTSLTEVRAK